jgi:hypothetical protein
MRIVAEVRPADDAGIVLIAAGRFADLSNARTIVVAGPVRDRLVEAFQSRQTLTSSTRLIDA